MAGALHRMTISLVAAAGCAFLSSTLALAQGVERQINDLISKGKLAPLKIGICIVDCPSGEKLATINEKTGLIPASNLKVITTGTALLVLGKDFEFTTRLVRDGDKLVIIGSGDPALAEPKLLSEMDSTVGSFIDKLAASVAASGTKGIKEVVLDDRIFEPNGPHPSWPKDQLDEWYCAPVSGLNFHANLLEIYCTAASRPGPSPMPRSEPTAPWIELVNNLPTVGTGNNSIAILRDAANPTRFKVQGSIRVTPTEPINITLNDAPTVLGRLLADRLTALGLTQGVPTVRFAGPDEAFDTTRPVGVVSTPLSRVLKRSNTDSYNLYADALLKRLGHAVTGQPGSWNNGAAVLRMTIADKVGNNAGDLAIVDGSGMSRDNRVSPLIVAQFLRSVNNTPGLGEAFETSLARPGEGTFLKRFRSKKLTCEVAGKSGFINGVQCLSGFVTHPTTGRRVAFSILVNDLNRAPGGSNVKEFHEDVVEVIDKWLVKNPRAAGPSQGG